MWVRRWEWKCVLVSVPGEGMMRAARLVHEVERTPCWWCWGGGDTRGLSRHVGGGEWAGGGNEYLLTSPIAREVPDGHGGGCELHDKSMESSESHRDGTGVTMSRVCVSGWSTSGVGGVRWKRRTCR